MTDPKTTLKQITHEAQSALGENLVSLILYGSHARGEAHARSDINLFIVVKDHEPEALKGLLKLIPAWQKRGVVPPVIFREDQMPRSRDSFALEFAEMAAAHQVLAGSDPFADFVPDWDVLRRELEREARQKRIAITRRWLASREDDRVLRGLLADTVPGLLTLLRCTLMLKQRQLRPLQTDHVLNELGVWPWFNVEVWRKLRAVAKGEVKTTGAELARLVHEYVQQAIALVSSLDQM